MRSQDHVEIADTELYIVSVLDSFGDEWRRPGPMGSIKIRCFFGFEHRDHGMERASRLVRSQQ